MNFVTIADLNKDIISTIERIPHDIDIVVGIPRSGMLVASIIALTLNKPCCSIDQFYEKRIPVSGKTKKTKGFPQSFDEIKKALIVEDSICFGSSIQKAKKALEDFNTSSIDFVFYAAYVRQDTAALVDIYIREIERPRLFEWNYLHSDSTESMCFDLDGVLCLDPTPSQNDDGKKYIDFIQNAPQKLIPSGKIGFIITSRLEKYRKETEKWLSDNHIGYNHLIMMDLPTAEERRKLNNHAEFKANEYKNRSDSILFVESSKVQAVKIAELSKKPVFCIENSTFYDGGFSTTISKSNVKSFLKKCYHFILHLIKKK